ncbi:toxin Cry1Ac domain D-VI-related protein, partial [Peribacillus muralis]
MKKSKILKPINVMTTSFLLASSLFIPTAGFAEQSSTPNKEVANAQESEAKGQESRTQTKDPQSQSKAVAARAANEAVVNNFAQLKTALEADNGITTIKLGQNIDISGPIKIQAKKTNILIDGNNFTVSETGGNGSSGGLYYSNGNILQNITVKNLTIRGKNYYGFITIHDASKNVTQVFENVMYSGPQMIWNRNGSAIFRGVNNININNTTMPGSSPAQEMAEIGDVEFQGDTIINHDNAYSVILTEVKLPNFVVAPNALLDIYTKKSGKAIFYATEDYGRLVIGKNAKVNINGQKSFTYDGALRDFIVDSEAELNMIRGGIDTSAMLSFYNNARINEKAKLNVSTENGVAMYAPYAADIYFTKPKHVLISSRNKTAFDNKQILNFNVETDEFKIWEDTSNTPTKTFKGWDGDPFKWAASYRDNGYLWGEAPNVEMYMSKTKQFELRDTQEERELSDAKNKVEGLFTDNKFDTLKGSTNQAAITEAQNAVNKLPAGPEKNRLQDLVNKAKDLLNKKEQAEKDLNDAKNKVEGLYTDNKFDTLKGTTNQAAVTEAQNAVNKLPGGPEKNRLQDLVNKAKDLLNKKEQAEKELNDAKNKVEDLFTDNKFDTLKETADQGAIDEAKDAVNKLPEGEEKDRLQDLLNKAQDLLNEQEQAEKDLAGAKNKVEDLFTDNTFDTLNGSTDQGAIDEAKEAVSKLPAGSEK